MGLVRVGGSFQPNSEEEYRAKKAEILSGYDCKTEYVQRDMLYCLRCLQPKMCDMPQFNFVVKCGCRCSDERWERQRNGVKRATVTNVRNGDYNPFD